MIQPVRASAAGLLVGKPNDLENRLEHGFWLVELDRVVPYRDDSWTPRFDGAAICSRRLTQIWFRPSLSARI